jgi:prolyl-tRNA editing enzyme YbaK/EbsC (Cys-tRNA(Pro) deacylase)
MLYHPLTAKITTLLKENNLWFETFEHQPVRTSQEAAQIRTGYTLHQGTKALIIRVKFSKSNKKFAMLVIPGDVQFDIEKVKAAFSAKDVRFASESEVAEITDGVQPGGVPPFGNLFELEVVIDPSVLQNEKIIFNAGDRSFSVGMKSVDYQKLVQPRITEIV